ncbi:MAG: RNA polymerase factor sigma-54 [Bacteroidia bacterium]
MALKQIQSLKQQLKLTPQQIQLLKLIQLPVTALEQKIQEELENNPALETLDNTENTETENEYEEVMENTMEENEKTDEYEKEDLNDAEMEEYREDVDVEDYMDAEEMDSYKYETSNSYSDKNENDFFQNNISVSSEVQKSIADVLMEQLEMQDIDEKQFQIGEYLVGCMDDDGYLRRDLQSISNDLLFIYNINASPQEIEEVLRIIQTFDPPGVGARNLQECLHIQIQRKLKQHPDSKSLQLANTIIEKYFEDYSKKHFDKLLFKLNITEEELKQADEEITHLNPKPGLLSSSEKTMTIIPDFIVNVMDGKPELSINNALIPELTISKEYIEMLNEYSRQKNKELKEASKFIKAKIEEAKWFIDALQQRERILLTAMYAIMEHQKEFFVTGDTGKLKPLLLKDIAEKIDADISTVSRIVNSKYVMTPYGTFPLKFFFSESMQKDSGEEVSNKEIKQFIQEAIQYENKKRPLTDDQLCELLTKKGYNIARRTVAKYREQLGIPVARLRKEI